MQLAYSYAATKYGKPRSIKKCKQTSWEQGKPILGAIEDSTGNFSKLGLVISKVEGREDKTGKLSPVMFDSFLDVIML